MKTLLTSTALVLSLLGAAQAQELRVALATFDDELDPQDTTGNSGAPKLYQVYDALIERDSFSNPLTFKPGLATSWEQVEPTIWELSLREGVTFHNGDTFDAHDVEFSLDRMFHAEDPEFLSAWGRWAYNFKDVEVIDDYTVRIHTHREEPLFETLMSARAMGIASKEYHEEVGFDEASINPVGTGPYRAVSFTPDERIELERFEDYWGAPAELDRVEMVHVPEVASRVTGIVNGEFDLATNIPPDQASALDVEGVETMGVTWPMFHVYVIAMNTAPTDDPRVRRAMRLCTDREALVEGLWDGKAGVPTAHQFPEHPLYDASLNFIEHDPEQARALLEEAGYEGEEIIAQFPGSYYLYGDLAAQVVQQQWQDCGLNLKIEEVDNLDYERLNMRGWSNPMYYPDPMGAMDTHWSEKSWTAQRELWTPNDVNPEWQATYERARFSTDPAERQAAYRELLEMSEEISGWLLLYKPHELYAMREGISFDIPVAHRPYVLPLRAGEIEVAPAD
ncbi:ABC transporter substrate-binding protein [Rhodosalinus sediminis]|uniref:ABC transporter substrate-binding protein n=1 Tax=Rhodosalinus sediminis TaxID=1940533 RepID=UPI0023562ADE|nr:ABC transporter substrate-binding protein [Rhodosalinus sediminis]